MQSHKPLIGVSDRDLEHFLRSLLFDRGYSALRRVTVSATNGVVTLRGKMPSFYMRQLAVECTKRASGVRQLVDNLQVDAILSRVGESLDRLQLNDSHDRPTRSDDLPQALLCPHGATSLPNSKFHISPKVSPELLGRAKDQSYGVRFQYPR